MDTLLSILKEPAVIAIGIELLVILIGKYDKSNSISKLIIKLGKALESKEKKKWMYIS